MSCRWDTLIIDHPDRETTRTFVPSHSDSIRNGWIGGQLPRLFKEHHLEGLSIDPVQVSVHYALAELAFGGHLALLQTNGTLSAERARQWWQYLQQADERGTLLISFTAFIVCRPQELIGLTHLQKQQGRPETISATRVCERDAQSKGRQRMGSGDDIQAGRVTTAESTTDVLGAVPSEQDVDFNGTVILRAAPQPGLLEPTHGLDGIHGVGHSDVILSGGTGVVGFGGLRQGTGLAGLGGGLNGQGGIGVHGRGGSASEPEVDPGAGMVAQGGMINEINVKGRFHGAGVIALSGGAEKAIPLLTDTGSVGVYAQGADAEKATVDIHGVPTVVGPTAPGPGVVGRGGVPIPQREEPVAAGVIGLAGDNPIPPISESGNVGVYGTGPTGVRGMGPRNGVEGLSNFMGVSGQGVHGPGVNGVGHPGVVGSAVDDSSRGGEFVSKGAAQVRLIPQRLQQRIPNQVTVTPTAIPVASAPALPRSGLAGDLMVVEMETEDKQHVSRLWLCVQSGTSARRARWSEVLLGASFDGQA